MKKLALVASIAAASFAVTANAAPKVYGKAFLTLEYDMNDAGGTESHQTALQSNASRIGFKGSEDLGNGLKALYKAEYAVRFDDNSSAFTARNVYMGLSHAQLGTVLAGRMDDPVKQSQKKVDVFNDVEDMNQIMAGEVRANNVLAYQTPKMETLPVTLTLATNLDERTVAEDSSDITKDNGLVDEVKPGYHASIAYDQDGIYLAAAGAWDAPLETRVRGGLDRRTIGDVMRLVGQAKFAGIQLGALYQNAQEDAARGAEENAWLLSAKYKIDGTNLTVKGQYAQSTTDLNTNGVNDIDAILLGVGGEYKFSKATKGHVFFVNKNYDNGAEWTQNTLGAGIEHKF